MVGLRLRVLPGDFRAIPHLAEGFAGLEATRKADLEDWMDGLGLDAVAFPAAAEPPSPLA